jgi:hypothetical protein
MGEVIVFKAEKDGTHLRPPPEGSAKIVFFTGVWHEPMNDEGGPIAAMADVAGKKIEKALRQLGAEVAASHGAEEA